jgi:hypothetical protein
MLAKIIANQRRGRPCHEDSSARGHDPRSLLKMDFEKMRGDEVFETHGSDTSRIC